MVGSRRLVMEEGLSSVCQLVWMRGSSEVNDGEDEESSRRGEQHAHGDGQGGV